MELKQLSYINIYGESEIEIITDNPERYIEELNKERELDGERIMLELEEEFLIEDVNLKLYGINRK
jgi:hypothetical protein